MAIVDTKTSGVILICLLATAALLNGQQITVNNYYTGNTSVLNGTTASALSPNSTKVARQDISVNCPEGNTPACEQVKKAVEDALKQACPNCTPQQLGQLSSMAMTAAPPSSAAIPAGAAALLAAAAAPQSAAATAPAAVAAGPAAQVARLATAAQNQVRNNPLAAFAALQALLSRLGAGRANRAGAQTAQGQSPAAQPARGRGLSGLFRRRNQNNGQATTARSRFGGLFGRRNNGGPTTPRSGLFRSRRQNGAQTTKRPSLLSRMLKGVTGLFSRRPKTTTAKPGATLAATEKPPGTRNSRGILQMLSGLTSRGRSSGNAAAGPGPGAATTPKPPGFFQKILGFFSRRNKPATPAPPNICATCRLEILQ